MEKELKFYTQGDKFYRVIEVKGEYFLKKDPNIHVMINCNRNSRFISGEKAELIQDRLFGTTKNPLYHLVLFDKTKHRYLNMKKRLRGIEVVE